MESDTIYTKYSNNWYLISRRTNKKYKIVKRYLKRIVIMNKAFDKLIKESNIDTWTEDKEDNSASIVMLDEEGDEFIVQVIDKEDIEFNIIGQAYIAMTMDIMDDIISVVHQYCEEFNGYREV